jgi:hypothetical protein
VLQQGVEKLQRSIEKRATSEKTKHSSEALTRFLGNPRAWNGFRYQVSLTKRGKMLMIE